MSDIRPFKALIYNKDKISKLADLVCPPYDVISDKKQEEFYKKNNFNFIRILLAKTTRKDNNRIIDRYTNARLTLSDWLKKKIIVSDFKEAVYFYLQEFIFKGERKQRLGFISLLHLKDAGKGSIYPHEFTQQGPKDDRLALLKATKANLNPIFTLFSDEERQINRIFDNYLLKRSPLLDLVDTDGGVHKIWALTDIKLLIRLKSYMKNKSIFIADGHHRYEVACEYRNIMSRRKSAREKPKDAPFNYIMTYFTDINSRGLTVLPIHRLLKKIPSNFRERLEPFFNINKVSDRLALSLLLTKAGRSEHAFGLYASEKIYLLRLKDERTISEVLRGDSEHYNHLDVVLLNKLIFKQLFNISDSDVTFIKDEDEAVAAVDQGRFKACFFLFPTKLEQIRIIALNNERMPPKSTYFYPKLLSGLLIHKF